MQKVVHMTSVHRLDDPRIFQKECRTLAAAGYDVVLVGTGSSYTVDDGVRVKTVPLPATRLERMTRVLWRLYRLADAEAADIYHFHDPELLVMAWIMKARGRNVIFDAHEDLPAQILGKDWIPASYRRSVVRLVALSEKASLRILDHVIAADPTIAARFPPSKTVIVQNFPRTAEFQSADAPAYGTRAPVVAYVGGVSRMRGVEEMVRAIGRVSPELDARLVLAGSLDPASLLDELDGVPGWDRTAYLGWQGPEQLRQLLSSARVGLVTLHPLPNYLTAFPTKLFEYMAAGIPVVASDFPLWRQIVTDAQCGFLVDPMNPSAIAEAVEFLLRHPSEAQLMGERGRNAACSKYDWKTQGEKLVRVYEDVLQGAEA